MTDDEAKAETRVLGDLFPRTNQTTLDFWFSVFKKYPDQKIVRRAIVEHAEGPDEFIDKTKLRATIENLSGNGPVTNPKDRFSKEKTVHQAKLNAQKIAKDAADESFSAVNAVLDGISSRELEKLKAEVLRNAKEPAVDMLHLSNVQTGRALRILMANHLKPGTVIAKHD